MVSYGQGSIRSQINAGGQSIEALQKIVGVTPRDRAATVLRTSNMNEAIVVALLGHTPNSILMAYGATPWRELKLAVKLL